MEKEIIPTEENLIIAITATQMEDGVAFGAKFNQATPQLVLQALAYALHAGTNENDAAAQELANMFPDVLQKYIILKNGGKLDERTESNVGSESEEHS